MKKVVFVLCLVLASIMARAQEVEIPVIIDDRFFESMFTDVTVFSHLSQDFSIHAYKANDMTYDCGLKGVVVVEPGRPVYLNLRPARFLMPLTFEDQKGVTNLTYENEFQAPYLALQFSFDGSYDPASSRGYKWIFSMKKKEIHVCASPQEAEKYNTETSIGVYLIPFPENLPRVALQNESSYLVQIVTPGLSFSNKTLDKNGGELGMSIADRQKVSKAGFLVIQARIMKELGERSIPVLLEIPIVEGAKVTKITDKFFPEISRGDLIGDSSLVETFFVNRTKYSVTVEGLCDETGREATLNLPSGGLGEEIFFSEKGFTSVVVMGTVNGQLIRTDLLLQATEDQQFQIILKNGRFEIR